MKTFRFVILIAFVVGCSTKKNVEPGSSSESEWINSTVTVNADQDTTLADSIFIYEYFLDYDSVTHEYGDVDEPTVHDYWNNNNREALRYYKLAAKISDVPAAQRLIFANYLLQAGMKGYVQDILSSLKNRSDTVDVFYTMNSYGISFEEFNIQQEVVNRYCPDIVYE